MKAHKQHPGTCDHCSEPFLGHFKNQRFCPIPARCATDFRRTGRLSALHANDVAINHAIHRLAMVPGAKTRWLWQ